MNATPLAPVLPKHAAPPRVNCRQVNLDFSWPWEQVERTFLDADAVSLGQVWREAPQPELAPATVRVARTAEHLLVFATLVDHHIHNPVEAFNAPAFLQGDAFEMFFRPAGQASYVELHVTPRNQLFQLRIPSAEVFVAGRGKSDAQSAWLISDRRIESRVRVASEDHLWWVLAAIPFDMVVEADNPRGAEEWLFSFSRYDYTKGINQPVLSSSSPHAVLNFHRQQEWGTLTFV